MTQLLPGDGRYEEDQSVFVRKDMAASIAAVLNLFQVRVSSATFPNVAVPTPG